MKIEIRSGKGEIDAGLVERVRRRLAFALSRFGRHVERVLVRLGAPRGADTSNEMRCSITVRLHGGRDVAVELSDDNAVAAVDRAAERMGRAVVREILWKQDSARKKRACRA